MSSDRKRRLDELVNQALAMAPDVQLQFIHEACPGDEALYADAVKQMQSRQQWFEPKDDGAEAGSNTQAFVAGEIIGAYRVIRSLGQGGMGEVFLAERADAQFRQQVAIKLVRRGLLSRHAQGRLRQERQILATLEHPNIARLYDGGATADGTPYIVMEYIDGIPIDTYCDQRALTIEQRLRLFMTVCSAVHRAHQNLIVHRDLKPSNILVTASGIPKLLDFGIAKLLDEQQTMHTMAVTQADVRVMTPDHASPEQIRGDLITTSSDIYVLGVLLYELLVGRKPFVLRSNRLAELERAICEESPPTLSGALAETEQSSPTALAQIAVQRSVSIPKLRRELRGDLDNIVMMAMRKEPERRYSSVEQLAADIERYVRGMPIAARADSWAYRADKFVRRQPLVVGLSTAFIVLLTGFSVSTYLQSKRISHERDVAQAERSRAEEVSSFLIDSFTLADPSHARGKEITAREILDSGATRISKDLDNQPALQATLLDTIGGVYLGLGQYAEAQPLIEQGLAVRRSLWPDGSVDVARSLYSLNRVYEQKGDLDKAEALARENLAINVKSLGQQSIETAQSLCRLGVIVRKKGELASAEDLFQQCMSRLKVLRGKDSELLTMPLDNLARIAQSRSDYARAESLLEESLTIDRATRGEDHPQYIQHLMHLASVKVNRRDFAGADVMFLRVLDLCNRVLGKDHPETIGAMSARALFLMDTGRLDEAEALFQAILAVNRKLYGSSHFLVGNDLERLGRLEFKKRHLPQAEAHFKDALDIYRRVLPPGHGFTASTLTILGRAQLEQNRAKDAEATLRLAMDSCRLKYGEQSRGYAMARAAYGASLAKQRRFAEAEPALVDSYPILIRTTRGSVSEMETLVQQWIVGLYRDMGRPDAAQKYFAQLATNK